MKKVLKVAVIGLGGFAHQHHEAMRKLEAEGSVQLIATCEPQSEKFAANGTLENLKTRGVAVYEDYLVMLDAHRHELDLVTIPTPIPLHAPMHRACVDRGLAVYLEKPPTLDWSELEAMIEVDKSATFATQVGFNFIVEAPRQIIKARLLAGEFGALKGAGMLGYWPRSEAYFRRAGWAGKLRVGSNLILDSCTGNALAHYVHNLLFWSGKDRVLSWGEVESVEAELYRAHQIESFDTVFSRGSSQGVPIYLAATHAGSGPAWQREWIECEKAFIQTAASGGTFDIRWKDGHHETDSTPRDSTSNLLVRNLRYYVAYLNGEEPRPLTTLEDSRPFVHLNDLLFVAAGHIATVASPFVKREEERGENYLTIEGVEAELERFAAQKQLPSRAGVSWAQGGGRALKTDLQRLHLTIDHMSAAQPTSL